jgi:hypothetical protein
MPRWSPSPSCLIPPILGFQSTRLCHIVQHLAVTAPAIRLEYAKDVGKIGVLETRCEENRLGEFVRSIAGLRRNRFGFWTEQVIEFLEKAGASKGLHYVWRNRRKQFVVGGRCHAANIAFGSLGPQASGY